jgi:predicted nucleic acid-binding protein
LSLVLDASATLNFVMPDEFASGTVDLLEMIRRVGSWVPSLWRLEIANSLSVAVRRRRITRDFRDDTLDDLSLLDIRVDDRTDSAAWGAVLTLADRHGLSVYDAAYLELAQRRRLPLATLDARLSQAAAVEAVPLVFA